MQLMNDEGEPKRLSTRFGSIGGQLKRTHITILADDGDSIELEATVFVPTEWTGGNFLGYGGLLERVRFAVDPQENFFTLALALEEQSESTEPKESRSVIERTA
jgi:hypothetical protein